MKFLKLIVLLFIVTFAFTACNTATKKKPEIQEVTIENSQKIAFQITGMTCEIGCAKTIQKKLANMEGVKSAKVDFKNEMAMVEYDVAKANPMSISKTVTSVSDTYSVDNMKTVVEFTEYKKACEKKCKKKCSSKKA